MPMLTDYVQRMGLEVPPAPSPAQWVLLQNRETSALSIATATADRRGKVTMTVPGGTYRVFTADARDQFTTSAPPVVLTANGIPVSPWALVNENYVVPDASYVPALNAYVPPQGFPAWSAATAKALAGTGIATVWNGFGASITGGNSVSDIMQMGYPARWRARQKAVYGIPHGDTFPVYYSNTWNAANNLLSPPFTHDTTPSLWAPTGPWWLAAYSATGTAMSAGNYLFHYTHPTTALGYRGLSFRIFYWDPGTADGGLGGNSATWQYNLNGGTAQTVTLSANGGNCLIRFVDITSATPGWSNIDSQVINFGNQNANSALQVICVACYPTTSPSLATSGVHYVWLGMAGLCMGDLMYKGGNQPSDKIARYVGTVANAAPYARSATLAPPFSPDLVVGLDMFDDVVAPGSRATLNTSPNTKVLLTTADGYLHGLREMRDAWRSKPATSPSTTGTDVAMHIPALPVGVVSDSTATPLQLENREHFKDAMKRGGGASWGWVDSDEEWHDQGFTLGMHPNNSPHPLPKGMQDVADRFARIGL